MHLVVVQVTLVLRKRALEFIITINLHLEELGEKAKQ